MKLPKLILVGRPNVGKSALFNAIVKKRKAIVHDIAGVTRDLISEKIEVEDVPLEIIDTGGLYGQQAQFQDLIEINTNTAVGDADVIIFCLDATEGVTPSDLEISRSLHITGKPVICAVNKVDSPEREPKLTEFYELGFEKLIPVSALHRKNLTWLLEESIERLPFKPDCESLKKPDMQVAILGRPNVGKSSILNAIVGSKRSIVSDIAGTTRDAIDTHLVFDNLAVTLVDTAGMRRKQKVNYVIDKFADMRTLHAIDKADVCILVIDVEQGLTTFEKQIIALIEDEGKACLIAINKWDLQKKVRMEHIYRDLKQQFPFLSESPMICVSALSERNIDKLLPLCHELLKKLTKKITTSQLNSTLEAVLARKNPPVIQGKRFKVFYVTQTQGQPPHFVFFVNNTKYLTNSYERYLKNQWRQAFDFKGVPIRFTFRSKEKRYEKK